MIKIVLVDDDEQHLTLMKEYIQRFEIEQGTPCVVLEFMNGLNFVEDYEV